MVFYLFIVKNMVENINNLQSFLTARSIRDSFFSGEIDVYEAHERLKEWRSFEAWGYSAKSCSNGKKEYLYGKQSKRGSKTYFEQKRNDAKIRSLLNLGVLFGEEFPLVENDRSHFLMLTLTYKPRKDRDDDLIKWNGSECSREVIKFKKRFRNFYGQDVQFARFDEAHVSGYIHIHLLVYSPTYAFEVYEHISKKRFDQYGQPVKTWRLVDYADKQEISAMFVSRSSDENFVDVLAFNFFR